MQIQITKKTVQQNYKKNPTISKHQIRCSKCREKKSYLGREAEAYTYMLLLTFSRSINKSKQIPFRHQDHPVTNIELEVLFL